MIKVDRLTKTFGDFVAVDDVSFECRPGRVTGFLGPNGAGKTTTLRILTGLTRTTQGTATIGGHRYVEIPNPGLHVGVLLDASAQHGGRTGREVLTLGARTMGLPTSRVDEMLELVSLTPAESKRRVRNYSLGMRQRLGIARALYNNPSVLVMDEATSALDTATEAAVTTAIRELHGEVTVITVAHRLSTIRNADIVFFMKNGRVEAQGSFNEVVAQVPDFARQAALAGLS